MVGKNIGVLSAGRFKTLRVTESMYGSSIHLNNKNNYNNLYGTVMWSYRYKGASPITN